MIVGVLWFDPGFVLWLRVVPWHVHADAGIIVEVNAETNEPQGLVRFDLNLPHWQG